MKIDQHRPRIYSREEHSISRRDIEPDALKIMYRLIRHGFKAYLVGGGVRDLLLGRTPKDFDIGTDATPRQVKGIFRNSRIIGKRFKLIHVFFHGGKIIEVSTFRDQSAPIDLGDDEESEKKLIIRDNNYGTPESDAHRRDLTINGLFYDLSTFSIIDYVGGMDDLNAGLIRVIGDPDVRFKEDSVRLIRTVRHAVRTGFAIEENCKKSLVKNSALILKSSAVRVYEELKKDFSSGHILPILKQLEVLGVLKHLLPELSDANAKILGVEHDCARCLAAVDELVKRGQPVSPAVVLGIMALFIGDPRVTEEVLPRKFESQDSLVEHIRGCFTKFAVPRKERERVEDLLTLWYTLVTIPIDKLKRNQIQRRASLADAVTLFRCLTDNDANLAISALLNDLITDAPPEDDAPRRGSRPQRRRKSRFRQGRTRSPL